MISPKGHYVLIKPRPVEEVTKAGIVTSTYEQLKREQAGQVIGELVAIGPTAWIGFADGKRWAEVGEQVVYVRYGGKPFKDPDTGEDYIFLVDEDVIGGYISEGEDDE